ncbi:MAG: MBL fold metallo-hydrolase [Clostridia bacterium]|nr:MBL fold metallo-hydrolase [Clostridia bacterium]
MNNTIRKLLALLAGVLILSSVFCACAEDIPADTTSLNETTEQIITEAPETEAPSPSEYTILSGKEGLFSIVRPEELASSDVVVTAAIEIRKFIKDRTGVSLKLGDDWIAAGKEHDPETFEILVGATSHPESAQVLASIGYGDYAIRAVGNKIVVVSYSDVGYEEALKKFTALLRTGIKDEKLTLAAEDINIVGTVEKMTASLPLYTGGEINAVANAGDGCYCVVIGETNADEYKTYLSALAGKGYKTHASNDIAGNLFSTLYTENYTVNAGFYKNYEEVRIVIEPFSENTLPLVKSDLKAVTTPQLTMIGLDNLIGAEYQNNGLCLVYRLADGSFVIVDGGHSEDAAVSAADIIAALREQSKDYAKSDADIRIAAWIITHPHSDHFGTLVKGYSQFTKFKVERVFANFWDEGTFEAFKSAKDTFASGKYTTYTQTPGIAEKLGAEYIVPHVGQAWWIGGTKFEFLYTLESFLPRTTPTFNTSSLIFRSVTTDASGKEYKVMVTGDGTGYTMQIIADTFKEELKCDVVQLAHHGSITSGNSGGTQKAYEYMSPSVLFWPVGQKHYATVKEYTYNHVLHDSRNPNFAELYIAGWQGNSVTISLPYTLGTAQKKVVLEP